MKNITFFFLLFPIHCMLAQADVGFEAILNNQLSSYQVNFKYLMDKRGCSHYKNGDVDLKIIKTALSCYSYSMPNNNQTIEQEIGLLYYHFYRDTLHIWVLSTSGVKGYAKLPITSQKLWEMEVDMKRALNVNFPRGAISISNDNFNTDLLIDCQHKLYEVLFPDSISKVLFQFKRLFILPCLNIASIPLYALKSKDDDAFIIDKITLCTIHSMDDFLNWIITWQEERECSPYQTYKFIPVNPVIVGNPDYKGCSANFQSLPWAEKEAEMVAQRLQQSWLKGEEATKSAIIEKFKNTDFIYLATHGKADLDDPMQKSFLVFAGEDGKNCTYLNAAEIQKIKLDPETIVVLSACETALGKPLEAGVIGLGRSFLTAGAMNAILSLWSVDDKATMELMNFFLEELYKQQTFFPAEPLRQAMLSYKAINPNPAAWAPFTIMGTPYPALINLK